MSTEALGSALTWGLAASAWRSGTMSGRRWRPLPTDVGGRERLAACLSLTKGAYWDC
eukprot:COSAG02_NODE_4098_length_5781_cov_13.744984_6_plen_57_part_00